MTEAQVVPSGAEPAAHAGALIRAARQARGWSLSHVAMLLKLSERRLQALEDGRYAEVGDATFVRALVRSLCRHLGVEPQPVLEALPASMMDTTPPLTAPVRPEGRAEAAWRPSTGRGDVIGAGPRVPRAVRVGVAVLLAAALVLALLPYLEALSTGDRKAVVVEVAPAPDAASSPAFPPGPATEPTPPGSEAAGAASAPAPAPATAPAPAPAPASAPASALTIRASQATWVGVRDAQGQVLMSRILSAGETVGVDGARPLSVKIGNVAGTEVSWKGAPVDLQALQRSNVATFDLP